MNRRKLYAGAMAALAMFGMAVASALAQEARSTLSGTITDASGSAVVGAHEHITNAETGVTLSAASNEVGQYHLLFVNPGTYRLTVEMSGFHTFVRESIVLTMGEAATLDVPMEVGLQSESVTVEAKAPLLDAEKADRGLVVEQKDLSSLPVIARVPNLMATLTAGVTYTALSMTNITPFSNSALTSLSVNGSISPSAEFLLDGAPNDMIYQATHSVAYIAPVDAVAEFKVVTGAYDAQYGRNGGGVVAVALKSGTNTLHGTAYDFMQRVFLTANTFANNAVGGAKNYDKLDEFGFTVGGPVWIPKVYNGKNKTFFFVAYEHYHLNTLVSSTVSSVPTPAQRGGNFSQTFNAAGVLNTIYDPATGQSVNGTWVRSPFPGNTIPASRMDPVGSKMANTYPIPNILSPGSVNWQNNYFSPLFTYYIFPNFVARMDHNFGDKERIYGRYVYNNQYLDAISNNYLTGLGADNRDGNKVNNAIVLDSVTVLNPSTTLDIRVSMNRWTQNYRPTVYDASVGPEAVGLPASLVNQFEEPGRFPYITATNYEYMGESSSNIWYAPSSNWALGPTVSRVQGRHYIKAGLDFRLMHLANYQPAYAGGTFAFDQTFTRANYLAADPLTGNAIAAMLLGAPTSGEVDFIARPYYSWRYWAPWAQDDIKVSRRLTVNVGVRWDVLGPVDERYNRLNYGFFPSQVNPISSEVNQTLFPGYKAYGGIGFAGVNGSPRSAFNTEWKNIQPRIGAAFQLTPTTVLRGGFGISYIPQVSYGYNSGFSSTTPYVATLNANETPAGTVSNPFPSGLIAPVGSSLGLGTFLGQSPNFADPNGAIGYVYSFSFGIQKQLAHQIRIDASYVGSLTRDAPVTETYNALSRQNLALGDVTQGGNANNLNKQVPNPFQGLLPGTSLNSATVTEQQLLLPFPEFTALTESNIPVGKVWYNSLQVNVQKRYANGFSLTAAYTFSKNIQALSYLNPQDAAPARTIVPFDRRHVFVLAPVYELPFGPGRAFLNTSHGLIGRIVGGWNLMGNFTYQTGVPTTMPTGVIAIGNPVLPNPTVAHEFNSGILSNGTVTDQVNGLPAAWEIQPAFTLRTLSLYESNIRDRWGPVLDMALVKRTQIRERLNLELRVDALNAINHPTFGSDPVISPTSPQFGQLLLNNGQSNESREFQLSARLIF
jgi:hypothetical protein